MHKMSCGYYRYGVYRLLQKKNHAKANFTKQSTVYKNIDKEMKRATKKK